MREGFTIWKPFMFAMNSHLYDTHMLQNFCLLDKGSSSLEAATASFGWKQYLAVFSFFILLFSLLYSLR